MTSGVYCAGLYPAILFYLFISLSTSDAREPFTPHFGDGRFILFKDARSILQYFDSQKANFSVEIEAVLQAYEACFFAEDIPRSIGIRRPFIVIEGKDRKIRETVARQLADKLGGRYLTTPPKCLLHFMHVFEKKSLIRNAFFALSLYPAAFNARQLLSIGTPVVMNGYWTEQASYVIDKMYQRTRDLPPTGSWIYDYPRDLMMPDILFYIRGKQVASYYTTLVPNWRPKMVAIYSKFRNIPITLLDITAGVERTVDYMYEKMRSYLGDDYDFSPAIPYKIAGI